MAVKITVFEKGLARLVFHEVEHLFGAVSDAHASGGRADPDLGVQGRWPASKCRSAQPDPRSFAAWRGDSRSTKWCRSSKL